MGEDSPLASWDDHIISQKPYRLRWGDWRVASPIQVHVGAAAVYEDQRQEDLAAGRTPGGQMPMHFQLDGGLHETAQALLRFRDDESALVEVTYLACLMEALVNTPCAILRTDLIRRVYQEVDRLSGRLILRWRGRADRFMLPLNRDALDPQGFVRRVAPLDNLQEFFQALREIAQERHADLAKNYVIYYPRRLSL